MHDSGKYLIHADIRANGVVERSDVVGAIFGQTEGLLGSELDLRDLQESSKVGRIDVDVESEGGRSFGTVTVASGLDRVETAVLAAALETIERVGPCRAHLEVREIEDARAAKRRELVDRAAELLGDFEDQRLTSDQLIEAVRQRARVADIDEYEGLPAGPRVADSDAIVVVEGRADVRRLLGYGIKNAVAVEGTDVPDAVADLTQGRTVTAFLDGDRGGDLILRELAQVGSVDYVALAPAGQSVEDLSREAVMTALRKKVPYDEFEAEGDDGSPAAADAGAGADTQVDADGGTVATPPDREGGPAPDPDPGGGPGTPADSPVDDAPTSTERDHADDDEDKDDDGGPEPRGGDDGPEAASADDTGGGSGAGQPATLPGHVEAVVGAGTGRVRLLDEEFGIIAEDEAGAAFDAIADAGTVPAAVVLDGELTQRILDVAAQRGVGQVVAAETGAFVKQPAGVRVRRAEDLRSRTPGEGH